MPRFGLHPRIDALLTRLPFAGPARRTAFRRLGAARLCGGDFAGADAILSEGLKVFPRDRDLLFDYAMSANNRGLFSEALARWKAARAVASDDIMCWCGVAANLRSLGSGGAAEETVRQALDRFGDEPLLLVEAARVAQARHEHAEALRRWTDAIASCDPHPDWLHSRTEALLQLRKLDDASAALDLLRARAPDHPGLPDLARTLHLMRDAASDELPLPPHTPAVPDGVALAPDALFAKFESLGDNCEFGLVQRYNHIDPLGLFRFSSVSGPGLTRLFERRMEGYGGDDLEVVVSETDQSYDCRSIGYKDFRYHTDMSIQEIDADTLLRRERTKVEYLKKRLLSDMEDAEKIFVRKGGLLAYNIEVFRAMRVHGPVTFLSVEIATADHPAGSVVRVEDGLYIGYLARLAPYGNAHDIDMVGWSRLCCEVLSLIEAERGHRARFHVEATEVYRVGYRWALTGLGSAETVPEPSFPGGPTQRLVLDQATERSKALVLQRFIDVTLPPRAPVVFSVWVWIPETFKGTFIDVYFTNAPHCFLSRADLSRRGTWQRVWTSVRIPKGQNKAAVGLRITGLEGDSVFIGPWRLEAGSIPNDWELAPAPAETIAA